MADIDIADVRELLTAIREALTVPRHASYKYADASKQLLVDRTAMVRGVLTSFIKHRGEEDLLKEARILRELVAEQTPVTYPVREADVPVPVDLVDDEPTEPARELPQLAVPCPTCGSQPGALCTSHGGTRPRRYDTHQARTSAWAAVSKDGAR